MTLQWNKVTWYSRFFALLLLTSFPILTFYLGVKYGEIETKAQQFDLEQKENLLSSPRYQQAPVYIPSMKESAPPLPGKSSAH
jgi:hypothetical protein